MEPNSPFAPNVNTNVPLIGQPVILNAVVIALVQCTCPEKTTIIGPIGFPVPLVCPTCKKAWAVNAQLELSIQQVANPTPAEDSKIVT